MTFGTTYKNLTTIQKIWQYRQYHNGIPFVFLITTFNFLFVGIFSPFDFSNWYPNTYYLAIFLFHIFGGFMLWLSQYLFKKLKNSKSIPDNFYWIWIMLEGILIILTVFAIDATVFMDFDFELSAFISTIKYVSPLFIFSMIVSYLILHSYFQSKIITDLKQKPLENQSRKRYTFKDDQQSTKLVVDEESLLFVQSQDNYLSISYLSENKVKKLLIRNTLKQISESLCDSSFVKVHRSYLVNLNHLAYFQQIGKKSYLHLHSLPDIPIPISATYEKEIKTKIE